MACTLLPGFFDRLRGQRAGGGRPLATYSKATLAKIHELRCAGANFTEIAQRLGLDRGTVARRYREAYPESGGPPPLGATVQHAGQSFEVEVDEPLTLDEICQKWDVDRKEWSPEFFKANTWQGFYRLQTEDGHRKVRLYQTKASFKRLVADDVRKGVEAFARRVVMPLKPPKGVRPRRGEYAVSWGLWDAHIGMYAWRSEVGADYDADIAARRICNSIDDMMLELSPYKIDRIFMPVGNDYMHFDSARMQTAFGEHSLDVDTRFARVYTIAIHCLAYMVDRALELTDRVEILYVPGNHDYTASLTLTACLQQRYRNDKRVKVDMGANPRKYRRYGGSLICWDHGHECKPNQYALIFGTEAKDDWAKTSYREVQIGHKHQKWEKVYEGVIPTNGLTIRRHPALCNVDAWHHGKGWIGEPMKAVEAFRYDQQGYRGSHCVWARDDERPPATQRPEGSSPLPSTTCAIDPADPGLPNHSGS